MSQKLICQQDKNVTKIELSPKLKCQENWNVTKTEMLWKLKCYQNQNVTKTEMLPNIIMPSNQNQNPRDRHWSPWSCFVIAPTRSKNITINLCTFVTGVKPISWYLLRPWYRLLRHSIFKLDGVGPVDNRPSTDKLHHFSKKNGFYCLMKAVTGGSGKTSIIYMNLYISLYTSVS